MFLYPWNGLDHFNPSSHQALMSPIPIASPSLLAYQVGGMRGALHVSSICSGACSVRWDFAHYVIVIFDGDWVDSAIFAAQFLASELPYDVGGGMDVSETNRL